jgi:hypothetical protein
MRTLSAPHSFCRFLRNGTDIALLSATLPFAIGPVLASPCAVSCDLGMPRLADAGTLFLLDPPDVVRRQVMRAVAGSSHGSQRPTSACPAAATIASFSASVSTPERTRSPVTSATCAAKSPWFFHSASSRMRSLTVQPSGR